MKITIKRIALEANYTIGKLYIDDVFFCDTLEDTVRPEGEKIAGKTAIPAGMYPLRFTYSNKYKKYMPLIDDVPNFTGIRIHSGNKPEHTDGCILVGKNTVKGQVLQSRETFKTLYERIEEASNTDIPMFIEITNEVKKV